MSFVFGFIFGILILGAVELGVVAVFCAGELRGKHGKPRYTPRYSRDYDEYAVKEDVSNGD